MRIYTSLLILCLSVTSIIQAQNKSLDSKAWRKVDACGVSFILPPNVQEVKVYPIDSCVKHFRGEDIYIGLDVIFSSHTPKGEKSFRAFSSDKPEFQIREIQIAGVRSLIKTHYQADVPKEKVGLNYLSVLLVPYIGKDKRGLMMTAYSKTAEGHVIAQRIFESISPKKGKW